MMRKGIRIGPYVVEAQIGAGGLATVWRAHQAETGEVVALKVLNTRVPALEKRMVAEGRMQGRLHHPNVVHVFGLVYYKGAPVLVMEYVRGPSLATLLTEHAQLPLPQVEKIGADLLRGLAHAHASAFIHRALKPSHVLIGAQGDRVTAKLCDFGIAKPVGSFSDTETDVMMGSVAYMAPEQIRDAKNVDQRADVYGAGLVLYELLTGQPAFTETDIVERYAASSEERYPPTTELRPDAPANLHNAIKRALIFDRDFRPASATELLGLWQSGTDIKAPPAFTMTDVRELSVIRRKAQPDTAPPLMARGTTPLVPPEEHEDETEPKRHQLVFAGFVGGFVGMLILFFIASQLRTPVGPSPEPVVVPVSREPQPERVDAAALVEPPDLSEPLAEEAVEEPAAPEPVAEPAIEVPAVADAPAAARPAPPPPRTEPEPTQSTPKPVRPTTVSRRPTADQVAVTVEGVDEAWLVDSAGERRGLSAEPGSYELWASFDGRPTRTLSVELRAGRPQSFKCVPAFKVCKAQ